MATPTAATSKSGKKDRFSIRATTDEKALVERAARLSRMTMSQFVMQSAVRSAESVIADQTRFVLAPDDWEAFSEALDRPSREIAALKAAASKPRRFGVR